jgi:hypothetical protein
MFAIPGFIIGAIIGWVRATRLGGATLDKLQYAAGHGIALFLIALVLTVLADWMGWV